MKKIGFIDYYIDEWHANNYPAWIKEQSAVLGLEWEVAYAWADINKEGGRDTATWCAEFGIQQIDTIEEIIALSDAIIVLSPDHPEHHERLSQLALQSGKPVYMDKTFAPDREVAVRMFQRAAAHDTPLFSSSALRYSEELLQLPEHVNASTIEYVSVNGGGSFATYAVHQLEMIVALMGSVPQRIKALPTANGRLFIIDYGNGKQATMQQLEAAPFHLTIQLNREGSIHIANCSKFFQGLMQAIIHFFEHGNPPVAQEETIAIISLIDAGRSALLLPDHWIPIQQ